MSVSRQLGVASKVPGHGPSNLESKEWPGALGGSLLSASPRLRRTTPSGCMGTDGAGRGEGRSFSGGLLSNPVGWLTHLVAR